jgi:hypothetical protein
MACRYLGLSDLIQRGRNFIGISLAQLAGRELGQVAGRAEYHQQTTA